MFDSQVGEALSTAAAFTNASWPPLSQLLVSGARRPKSAIFGMVPSFGLLAEVVALAVATPTRARASATASQSLRTLGTRDFIETLPPRLLADQRSSHNRQAPRGRQATRIRRRIRLDR